MSTRRWSLAAWLVALGLVGCDVKQNGSETQSLDNFARAGDAALAHNQCQGEYPLMEDVFSPDLDIVNIHATDSQTATLLQSKVESALKAVPTEIQVAFFGLGGIIEVTPLTHDICVQGLSKEQKDRYAEFGTRITGCWKYQTDYYRNERGTLEKDPRVVIYVDDKPESIEHSLVRTFGYVLSQVLVKLDHEEGKPHVTTVPGDEKFEEAKRAVTEAFLADVAESEGKYDLSRFKDLLGEDILSGDAIARSTAWQALVESRPNDAKTFMDYVFAEAFDSQYCSPATREVMKRDFAKAADAFAPVHAAIVGLKEDLDEVDSEADLAKVGEETKVEEDKKEDSQSTDAIASEWQSKAQFELASGAAYFQLGLIRGFFRGVGRVIRAIGRGIVRVGAAVVRGAAAVARGVVRIGAAVIRATGRAAFAIFRGAARVARGIIVGAGHVIRGVARVTLAVGRAVVRATGTVIRGIFGPYYAFATESGMVLAEGILDTDEDGISDTVDLCSYTPKGAKVHKENKSWIGCAGGQYRDRDILARGWTLEQWYGRR